MFSVRKPSPSALDAVARDQREKRLSYLEVGATRVGLPPGYRHSRHAVELGRGESVFVRATEGLRRWQAHLRAGIHVHPGDAPVKNLTVVLAVPLAPVYVTVACRIVHVTEERRRFGFAYGTLPQHVIEGEEAFVVERDDADRVRFVVTAFFRPHGRLVGTVGPLVYAMDQRLVRRYLWGLRQHVTEGN